MLWEHKEKNGLCPVVICITINRGRTYHKTDVRVNKSFWDKDKIQPGYTNYDRLNAKITRIISDLEREIINRELNGEIITLKSAKAILKPDTSGRNDFLKYAEIVLAEKKSSTNRRYDEGPTAQNSAYVLLLPPGGGYTFIRHIFECCKQKPHNLKTSKNEKDIYAIHAPH